MNMKDLAQALRQAEEAHAEYERHIAVPGVKITKVEWPEFYARWLLDNTPLGKSPCV